MREISKRLSRERSLLWHLKCHNNNVYAYRKIIIVLKRCEGGREIWITQFSVSSTLSFFSKSIFIFISPWFIMFLIFYSFVPFSQLLLSCLCLSSEIFCWYSYICKFISSVTNGGRKARAMKDYLSSESITCPEYHPSKFPFEQIIRSESEWMLDNKWLINRENKSSANHDFKLFPWELICISIFSLAKQTRKSFNYLIDVSH